MNQPAPFACRPGDSRGRLYPEAESPTRTVFQRDRDRVIHSAAFRRLKHKTQVFVYHEGDYYRTRLTHSLEVAQIARSISRTLGINEDLAEALALAHDLGHTPFGHSGEDALHAAMAPFGGFDHNDQGLRILTRLERRYAEFDGLNLTWETLEGVVKHNGPLIASSDADRSALPATIRAYEVDHDLELHGQPSLEAQIAALSDDIAYNNHDIDDGLRAGLFSIEDLRDVDLVGPVFAEVGQRYPGIETPRLIHEAIRRMIDRMVTDLVAETRRRLAEAKPGHVDDVRGYGAPIAAFSEDMRVADRSLRDFLRVRMYRHYRVNRMASKARRIVGDLFTLYMAQPDCLPDEWQQSCSPADKAGTARVVADYIAGMTDRFALHEHQKLFDIEVRP